MASGELDGALAGHRDDQRRQLVGQRVEAGVFDGEVLAAVAAQLSFPKLADHFDRLFEATLALDHPRPVPAEDVLVEVLAGADTEREATRQQARSGGGSLGDDRRLDSDRRTGDTGDQLDPLGSLGDRSQHPPDKRALTLRVGPGVEVI